MSFEKIAGEDERLTAAIDATYAELGQKYQKFHQDPLVPERVAQERYCLSASSFLTRRLLEEGIVAGRESSPFHLVTTLEDPRQAPSDQDLIVCLTWGQFSDRFNEVMGSGQLAHPPAYIGRRVDILPLIMKVKYYQAFDPVTIYLRQYTYTQHSDGHFTWLRTKPGTYAHHNVPLGLVDYDDFERYQWEPSCR